jgi:hypothetical protein
MKLDGNGLLAASRKLQEEAGMPEERATWIAGLMLSAYFGSERPLEASVDRKDTA